MANCDCGGCSSCGGCARDLLLTQGEIDMMMTLAQIPFLPVARRRDDMIPVYLEDTHYDRETMSLIIQCLEKKHLIDIDYRSPLHGFDYKVYENFPVHGSIALTERGHSVVEMLELQGVTQE